MDRSGLGAGLGSDDADYLLSLLCDPPDGDIIVEDPANLLPFDYGPIGDDSLTALTIDIAASVTAFIDEDAVTIEITWDPDRDGQYERIDCSCDSSLL